MAPLSAGNASETIDIVDLPLASTAQPTFEFGARSASAAVRVLFFPVIGHSPFFGAPMAYAGADQTVPEETQVALNGSASYDPGGDPLTYQWQQIAGTPVALDLSDPSHPVFTAPSIAGGTQTLTFSLVVSDGQFTSAPDTVDVTVRNVNHAPVADAGLDQTVAEGSPVILNGANSFDRDDEPLAYRWLQTGGPIVALTSANTGYPSFTAPLVDAAGATLTFALTVSDGTASTIDSVDIRVENVNHPPVANGRARSDGQRERRRDAGRPRQRRPRRRRAHLRVASGRRAGRHPVERLESDADVRRAGRRSGRGDRHVAARRP